MHPALIVALIIVMLVVIYVIGTYNRLVNLRQLIGNAWSNIDTELKRRYDLIPNLVATVQGYAKHEKDVFERVVAARNQALAQQGGPRAQAHDENQLVAAMKSVFAVAESYPQLKANDNFLSLQKELTNTEDRIQAARRFYNGNVKDLNSLIGQFPSNFLANSFGFKPAEFFEIESAIERQPIAVKM